MASIDIFLFDIRENASTTVIAYNTEQEGERGYYAPFSRNAEVLKEAQRNTSKICRDFSVKHWRILMNECEMIESGHKLRSRTTTGRVEGGGNMPNLQEVLQSFKRILKRLGLLWKCFSKNALQPLQDSFS